MQPIGIDAIGFYTSNLFVDLATIAKRKNIDCKKYYVGLGQHKMAVPAIDEDIVSLAANAADKIINDDNRNDINTVLFATESGIDQSKAAGIYVHHLLQLPQQCRVVELKQACYSSTAAIQMGLALVARQPNKKVLVIASDIARYGLNTPGEPTQGCGAVALLLSANPKCMVIEPESGFVTQDIMDFWRPNYREEALVEGKYSSKMYLTSLTQSWQHYKTLSGRTFEDHHYFCYHAPVSRLVEKAHHALSDAEAIPTNESHFKKIMQPTLHYNRIVGNCYTASLFISLASLIDNSAESLAGKRVGFYSYGSGCVAEYYSGVFADTYRQGCNTEYHQALLNRRQELNYDDYASLYTHQLPKDGSELILPKQQTGKYRLAGIRAHKLIYERA